MNFQPNRANRLGEFEVRRYCDPSGAPHVRTPPHWQLIRNGDVIFTAPTKRAIIEYRDALAAARG